MGFLGKDGMMARHAKAKKAYQDDSSSGDDSASTSQDDESDLAPPDPSQSDEEGFPGEEPDRSPLDDAEPDAPSTHAALDTAETPDPGPGELPTDLGMGIDPNDQGDAGEPDTAGPDPAQAPGPEGDAGIVPTADPSAPPVPPGAGSPQDPRGAPGIETQALAVARKMAANYIAQRAGSQGQGQ